MTFIPKKGEPLTGREEHVLYAVADGMTNDEIAVEMHLSVHTVNNHIHRLLAKLGARNRAHAVALAYHHGILVPIEREAA